MAEVQEALFNIGGYETILSHIHNSFTSEEEMTRDNEVICKWATYCLCCCLGDVLEPLEYVKKELRSPRAPLRRPLLPQKFPGFLEGHPPRANPLCAPPTYDEFED